MTEHLIRKATLREFRVWITCSAMTAIGALQASPATAAGDDIFGTWMRGDGAARVTVAPCGPSICATNVWIRDPAAQNENVGEKLVFNIARTNKAWSGTGQDPKRNVSFNATLKANAATMQTTGCVLGGILCNTTNWTRE